MATPTEVHGSSEVITADLHKKIQIMYIRAVIIPKRVYWINGDAHDVYDVPAEILKAVC